MTHSDHNIRRAHGARDARRSRAARGEFVSPHSNRSEMP